MVDGPKVAISDNQIEGSILDDRFYIHHLLGKGNFGAVYLAVPVSAVTMVLYIFWQIISLKGSKEG